MDADTEGLLRRIAEEVDRLNAQANVVQCLMGAMVRTHPDPELLAAEFETYVRILEAKANAECESEAFMQSVREAIEHADTLLSNSVERWAAERGTVLPPEKQR